MTFVTFFRLLKIMDARDDDFFIFNMSNPFLKAAAAEPYDFVLRVSTKEFPLNTLSDPLNTFSVVLYLQKNSYLTKVFSEKVQSMMAAGLTEYWIKQEGSLKLTKVVEKREPQVMSVNELSAPFYICVCGLILSTACFISEIVLSRFRWKRQRTTIEFLS
jgi:hypothetical protein